MHNFHPGEEFKNLVRGGLHNCPHVVIHGILRPVIYLSSVYLISCLIDCRSVDCRLLHRVKIVPRGRAHVGPLRAAQRRVGRAVDAHVRRRLSANVKRVFPIGNCPAFHIVSSQRLRTVSPHIFKDNSLLLSFS